MQEKHVKEKQIQHLKSVIALQEKLKTNQKMLINVKEQMQEINSKVKEMAAIEKRDIQEEFVYRSGIKDLNTLANEWDQLQEQAKEIEGKLQELENSRPRYSLIILIPFFYFKLWKMTLFVYLFLLDYT